MAMLQVGSGGMGETAVTTTGEPTTVDKFLGGAKVWLNPGYITTEMEALWAGLKADAVGTLTNPRALGFLLVPVAALAVVWGMAAAKRRRKNPRRRARVVVRRRNPRHSSGSRWRPRKGAWAKWGVTRDYVRILGVDTRNRTAKVELPDGSTRIASLGELHAAYSPMRNPGRRRNAGPRSIRRISNLKRNSLKSRIRTARAEWKAGRKYGSGPLRAVVESAGGFLRKPPSMGRRRNSRRRKRMR